MMKLNADAIFEHYDNEVSTLIGKSESEKAFEAEYIDPVCESDKATGCKMSNAFLDAIATCQTNSFTVGFNMGVRFLMSCISEKG
jgi:hypothetical protein